VAGCGHPGAGNAEGCSFAANNPVSQSDPAGSCAARPGYPCVQGPPPGPAPGGGGTPPPGGCAANPSLPGCNGTGGGGGGTQTGGYTNLGPGVKVQNDDPKTAALTNAYYNYLDNEGINGAQVGLSQSYGIWLMICQASPGLCPGSMYTELMKAGSGILAAGGVFVVSSAFNGGAIPVPSGLSAAETNAYVRAYQIYNSPDFDAIRGAQQSGEFAQIRVADTSVQYEPGGLPGEALTLKPDGFALGPRAFVSEEMLASTILHESYRLETEETGFGSAEYNSAATDAAFSFSMNNVDFLLEASGADGGGITGDDGDGGGGE
jgi:hypothetical protein